MSDVLFADQDPAIVVAQALADYKAATVSPATPNGITLAAADPRRLHLQALLLFLAQMRQLINFAGKQNLPRYVSDQFIDDLCALWGIQRIESKPAQCTERYSFPNVSEWTIPDGARVTDGKNVFKVVGDTTAFDDHVDCTVECLVNGSAANGITPGQITTMVDTIPFCTGVSNTTETISGRETEDLEALRERLRDAPEAQSTCGPRTAYEAFAVGASSSVADAVALGPDDGAQMFGSAPNLGNVLVLILKGVRAADGSLISVVPEPDGGLISTVSDALTAEDVRPLTDFVGVAAPVWVDFDVHFTYYIPESRSDSAAEIEVAVQAAFDDYLLWQQSAIGRDLNPDELTTRVKNAGAKRLVITGLAFTSLKRDQSARLYTSSITFGGVEDD